MSVPPDPIQIHAPTLQVQFTGVTGSGAVPLSASGSAKGVGLKIGKTRVIAQEAI